MTSTASAFVVKPRTDLKTRWTFSVDGKLCRQEKGQNREMGAVIHGNQTGCKTGGIFEKLGKRTWKTQTW